MLQCCVHLNGVIEQKQRLCTSCTCILHFGTFRGCPSPDNDVNRPFSSSRQPLLQSESKCEVFVMGISSSLHMNIKTSVQKKNLALKTRFEEEADMNSEMAY